MATKWVVSMFATALLAFAVGCTSKPQVAANPEAPPSYGRSFFVGTWEGKDSKGDLYSFRFTATEWESHVDKDGVVWPYFRGTYSFTGTSATLRIAEEGNPRTGRWMADRGNIGQNVSARISGSALRVQALSDADMIKKQ